MSKRSWGFLWLNGALPTPPATCGKVYYVRWVSALERVTWLSWKKTVFLTFKYMRQLQHSETGQGHKVGFGDRWPCMQHVFMERMSPRTYLHTRMGINAIPMNPFSSWTSAAFAFRFAIARGSHRRMFFLKGVDKHSESSV